jgi:hypothetical protein
MAVQQIKELIKRGETLKALQAAENAFPNSRSISLFLAKYHENARVMRDNRMSREAFQVEVSKINDALLGFLEDKQTPFRLNTWKRGMLSFLILILGIVYFSAPRKYFNATVQLKTEAVAFDLLNKDGLFLDQFVNQFTIQDFVNASLPVTKVWASSKSEDSALISQEESVNFYPWDLGINASIAVGPVLVNNIGGLKGSSIRFSTEKGKLNHFKVLVASKDSLKFSLGVVDTFNLATRYTNLENVASSVQGEEWKGTGFCLESEVFAINGGKGSIRFYLDARKALDNEQGLLVENLNFEKIDGGTTVSAIQKGNIELAGKEPITIPEYKHLSLSVFEPITISLLSFDQDLIELTFEGKFESIFLGEDHAEISYSRFDYWMQHSPTLFIGLTLLLFLLLLEFNFNFLLHYK